MDNVRQAWWVEQLSRAEPGFSERWQNMNAQFCDGFPMLDWRFQKALINRFADKSILGTSCSANGRPIGSLLLERKKPGIYGTFLPSQSQISPVLLEPGRKLSVPDLFAALPRSCMRLDLLYVDPLTFDVSSIEPSEFVEISTHGLTMNISLATTFEDYWGRRSKKLKSNISRYLKRIDEGGFQIRLELYQEAGAIVEALKRYAELESAGWKGEFGTAIQHGGEQEKFYEDVLSDYGATGEALAFELYFGDRVVASRLCIVSRNMVIALKTTYDESLAQYSPGRVLLYLFVKALFELNRFTVLEFCTNATRDQLAWADTSRETYNVSIYRSAATRRLFDASRRLKRNAADPKAQGFEVHTDWAGLAGDVKNAWMEYGKGSIFTSWEWFDNFQKTVGPALGELRVYVLKNTADECIAILPAYASSRFDGRLRELSALGNYYTPYFMPIVNEKRMSRHDAQKRMIECIIDFERFDRFNLRPLTEIGDMEAMIAGARARSRPVFTSPISANWSVEIADFEKYLAERPANLRNVLKRKGAKVAALGKVEFRIAHREQGLKKLVQDYQRVYAASWKPGEPYPEFIDGLVNLAAANGWLRLGLVYIEDEPAAAQIWLVKDKVASIYKLAYSEQFSSYSVGTLLTVEILRHVINQDKVTKIDYLTGDDLYKRDWMVSRKDIMELRILNVKRPLGCLLWAKEMLAGAFDALRPG